MYLLDFSAFEIVDLSDKTKKGKKKRKIRCRIYEKLEVYKNVN